MGVDLWVELDQQGNRGGLPAEMEDRGSLYGRNVYRARRYLDELCKKLGCRPFGDFILYTWSFEDEELYENPYDDDCKPRPDVGPWFDPSAFLPTMQALETYLRTQKPEGFEYLLWDLEAIGRILSSARPHERFRLAVG